MINPGLFDLAKTLYVCPVDGGLIQDIYTHLFIMYACET